MTRNITVHLVSLLLLVLSGCASSPHMKPVPEDQADYILSPDKAQIIFMRPSTFGGAVQSSVFEVRTDKDKLVGIVSAQTKVRYIVEPGTHMFMAIGESADFMKANVAAGKTYYALVTPRMGMWKARFSLKPIKMDQLSSEDFKDWNESTSFVQNTDASYRWAAENWQSIQSKKGEYFKEEWSELSETEKQELTLDDQDGI